MAVISMPVHELLCADSLTHLSAHLSGIEFMFAIQRGRDKAISMPHIEHDHDHEIQH
jgi:hypothetical protein